MLKDEWVEVTITNAEIKWYRSKGYDIPIQTWQAYMTNAKGKRIKNGIERRVAAGTKLKVRVSDLKPSSNKTLTFICESCGIEFTTTWGSHRRKKSNNCKVCQAKKGFKGGCQGYWGDKLIDNNPGAKCDISGETDKRFLVLHHLLSRNNGGKNDESNYVILSANYHTAFHRWNGGTTAPCTPDDYYEFKRLEMERKT